MSQLNELDFTEAFVELIRRASTELPPDMEAALRAARETEEEGSAAQNALDTIIQNVEKARDASTPICQDTGTPIFEVYYPIGISTRRLAAQIQHAAALATERAYLRPNAVDSLTGKNSGDNSGEDFPTIHFHEWDDNSLHVDLLLKGGGCENVSAQYKLPDAKLHAGRDLDGVRRVVLDAVYQAQGKGCSPSVLGVAIGGDRGSSYLKSKKQLLRPLGDTNPVEELAELEKTIHEQANELGIGPMGFGGKSTVLGVKAATQHRLPASYFVSIAYMCWANRRASMDIDAHGEVELHHSLTTPIPDEAIEALRVGDTVSLNGIIITRRDAAHKFMVEHYIRPQSIATDDAVLYNDLKKLFDGGVIYHCGPVVAQDDKGNYAFVAAGPTTSIREEVYQPDVIEHFNVKGVIGKGGMGANTLKACEDHTAVYMHAIGGAATLIAQSVQEVVTVHKLEFGVPEAMWVIRVEDFPVVITMDSHGQSIHDVVQNASRKKLARFVGP